MLICLFRWTFCKYIQYFTIYFSTTLHFETILNETVVKTNGTNCGIELEHYSGYRHQ